VNLRNPAQTSIQSKIKDGPAFSFIALTNQLFHTGLLMFVFFARNEGFFGFCPFMRGKPQRQWYDKAPVNRICREMSESGL
jgi:hypothetical protein